MKSTILPVTYLNATACLVFALSSAQAATIFEANFDSGTAANTGSIVYTSTNHTQIALESSPHAKHGTHALLADGPSGGGATDIRFTPTAAASLAGGDTAIVSLDVQWRRSNGQKSHYLTGYDSSNIAIFQFVMADVDEFSNNSGNDRQQPGYGTEAGSLGFLAADIATGSNPGTFYIAQDGNPGNGYNGISAHFDITVAASGWTVAGQGSFAGPFTTNTLPTFQGSSFADLAYVEFTGETTASGAYIDNVTIVTVPEPSSTALFGLGGLALILRRRK